MRKEGCRQPGSTLPGTATAWLEEEEMSMDPSLDKVLQPYKAHILHLKPGYLM